MGLLTALITLLCIYTPACWSEGCSRFRNLDNGQTFFRYGGLLVVFRCHPGYKLHGHKSNSCVSGTWSREPAVCVAPGCPPPGPLPHGTSSVNEDSSWVQFRCNSGFRLLGPSVLYCKGRAWNSTKPVCEESDIMGSLSGFTVQEFIAHQAKSKQQSHYDHLAKRASHQLKMGPLSHPSSQISASERITVTNLKEKHLQVQLHGFKIKDATLESNDKKATRDSHSKTSLDEAEHLGKVTPAFSSKSHQSPSVSPTVSLVSGTFPTAQTPAVPAFTIVNIRKTSPLLRPRVSRPQLGFEEPFTSSQAQKNKQSDTGLQFQVQTVNKKDPMETSPHSSPSVHSIPSPAASTQFSRDSLRPFFRSDTSTGSSSSKSGYLHPGVSATFRSVIGLNRRPVCPYPPVPAHGTFHFRNVENPGPRDFRHYIQYACYHGYTLAHGDVNSYCQQGGVWTGVTPVCLELTPCSVNNGGCSQLCSLSQIYNLTSNQNHTRAECHCRPGFVLLDDGRTCRDLDECVEGQPECQQGCINTFGSFKCSCDEGYQPALHQTSCTDVDECVLPAAVTGCVFGCVNTVGSFYCQCPAGYRLQAVNNQCQDIDECADNEGLGPCVQRCHNSPGSFRCSCSYGHILAGDGLGCVAECPPGYRKRTTESPDNSTAPTLKEECVDVNECLEEMCEWQCINLPGSHRCICPRGFTLQRDGRRCKDTNECHRRNGGCSHMCVNQRGGYKCACPASHRLSSYSWKKCLPRTTSNTSR